MIEKIIHQIWVGPYDIPNRENIFVESVKNLNPSFEHILWTNNNLPNLPENIKQVFDMFYKSERYAMAADILRVFLIKEFGGLYIDIDFKPIKTFDLFDNSNSNFFSCYHHEDDFTMPNAVIGGEKNNNVISYICNSIDISTNNYWYGPSWFGGIVKKYLNLEYKTPQDIVKKVCEENNIHYCKFSLFQEYFRHIALYSWSDENVKNFKSGNINYTTDF